jgi:hypothetical protein
MQQSKRRSKYLLSDSSHAHGKHARRTSKRTTEDSDNEEDNGIVKYGGFVGDDETDDVERRAVMKRTTKTPVVDDNVESF